MVRNSVLVSALALICQTEQTLASTPDTKPLTSSEKNVETLGTGVAIALPLTAGAIVLFKRDKIGLYQLFWETTLTMGTAYALKHLVREERPDGSDFQSFPSDTTALAASGSSFLWGRYGWEYGLPATALTEFASYSRVQARQHRWYDTLASSAIAAGYGYFITTPLQQRYHINTAFTPKYCIHAYT
jgi:membrane-associated phospholipid phosphatase